jgi:predicted translin family RNA/ssDNA-binding protein
MKELFNQLKKDYQSHTQMRRLVISQSNEILHQSKQVIFLLHRHSKDKNEQADKFLKEIEKKIKKINLNLKEFPELKYSGVYQAAREEYLEAKLFWQVLKYKKIKPVKGMGLNFSDYLAASCDLTGELVRKMILLATENKFDQTKEIKEIITEVVQELTQFDLTGYLRHKYDEAKRNLKKAEEILYELKLRKIL